MAKYVSEQLLVYLHLSMNNGSKSVFHAKKASVYMNGTLFIHSLTLYMFVYKVRHLSLHLVTRISKKNLSFIKKKEKKQKINLKGEW